MPRQTHAQVQPSTRDSTGRTETDDVVDQAVADAKQRNTDALETTDDLLDEIDALLEENVLEVLQSYVQRGGQ